MLFNIDESSNNPIDNLDLFLKKKTEAQKLNQEKLQIKQDELIRMSQGRKDVPCGGNMNSESLKR